MKILTSLFSLILNFFVNTQVQTKEVVINNTHIQAEVANTQIKRTKGLMYKSHLDQNKGMLFIFPKEAQYTFWMANTKIPLDILWINQDKLIVYINKDTPPCHETNTQKCPRYTPTKKAKYVLEVNSGWVEENNVQVGNNVEF